MVSVVCKPCHHRSGSDHTTTRRPLSCPRCGNPMTADMDDVPEIPGFVYFDHTFTPAQAAAILEAIPADAHHWRDMDRKAPDAVARYTTLMVTGEWRDETLEHGFYDHPIRWDEQHQITHGVMRLLACAASGRPFRACVLCPIDFRQEVAEWQSS